jgi:hypothetical protein
MSDDVTIVRVSALNNYPDCERRGAASLFRREIIAAGFKLRRIVRGIGAVVGTAVHKASSVELAEKAKTGELPPVSVALDAGRDTVTDQLKTGEVQFEGPRGTTHNTRDAVAQVVMMARAYHIEIAPQINPIVIEERLEAEVEPGLVLSGQPDMVCREPKAIRDTKTGVRAPASFAAQLGGYSLLARTHGFDIERGAIDYLRRVAPNKPQPLPITREAEIIRAETAATSILRHIAHDLEVFRRGDIERGILPGDPWAFTANPASMLCSPKFCPAFGTEFCHEGDLEKLEGDHHA